MSIRNDFQIWMIGLDPILQDCCTVITTTVIIIIDRNYHVNIIIRSPAPAIVIVVPVVVQVPE